MKSRIPILFACFAFFAVPLLAQSGRVKTAPTPTPTPKPFLSGPSVLTIPKEQWPQKGVKVEPTPTPASDEVIKVSSALVPIPVSVVDQMGRAVTDLKLSDFVLTVDGKPEELADLAKSDMPIRMAMLFDNSASVMIARDFEKDAAVSFFRRVIRPDKDMAALFSVADRTRREQPLTKDVGLLTQAIQFFPEPSGATALLDGIIEVAQYLGSAKGRRVVVIVSDGEDTVSDDRTTLEGVVRTLQERNCQVYVMKTSDFENYKRTGSREGNANIRALTAERRMLEIARATGGAVYSPVNESEMNAAYNQISAELSQQYILSYYPDDESDKRGQFRSITLSIHGRPNLSVRTRNGYYVPKK
jgi:Ca-activated chloride channel family protein